MKKANLEQVKQFLQSGQYLEAAEYVEQDIEKYPDTRTSYLYLGVCYVLMDRSDEAQTIWATVLLDEQFQISGAVAQELSQILEEVIDKLLKHDEYVPAIKLFGVIVEIDPGFCRQDLLFLNNVQAWQGRILQLLDSHQYEKAVQESWGLLYLDQNSATAWNYLASAYYFCQNYYLAEKAVLKALQIDNRIALFHYNYALILDEIVGSDINSAIFSLTQAIKLAPNFIDAYLRLANLYNESRDYESMIKTYSQGLKENHDSVKIALDFYDAYLKLGMIERASFLLNERLQQYPEQVIWKYISVLQLPSLYVNQQQIIESREKFSCGLAEITDLLKNDLDNASLGQQHLNAICLNHNFYLPYQCLDDLELQIAYGRIVKAIVDRCFLFPDINRGKESTRKDDKIKIGFMSGQFFNHPGTRWLLGWIENLNHDLFNIYCYYFGHRVDAVTQQYIQESHSFKKLPREVGTIFDTVLEDNLDVLIYPDIGMDPLSVVVAAKRLAPIQCNSWGHPVTSGLSTIDYYFSSELMEPPNGDAHYSETLIRLPGLGICFPPIQIPKVTKTRIGYGLSEDKIVYVSCQTLFKYLPQYDWVYPRIALAVKSAQFMFVDIKKSNFLDIFKERLHHAFKDYGLNYEDYCVFLPRLEHDDYFQRHMLCDIYLDTIGFSGGNTALHAVTCNLPIVTYAGEFMRGRLACGVLKAMGITETIATSVDEYVDIAIRLGLDQNWRSVLKNKIKLRSGELFNDTSCVTFLEDFFLEMVKVKGH